MNPFLLILIGVLWIIFIGGFALAYLEKKLEAWGLWLVVIFILALISTILGVMSMGSGTATMN